MVEQVAEDVAGRGVVAMVNVDENPGVRAKYGVRGIPALVVLKDGVVVGRIHSRDRQQIVNEFRQYFGSAARGRLVGYSEENLLNETNSRHANQSRRRNHCARD